MKNLLSKVKNWLKALWSGLWKVLGKFPFISFVVILIGVIALLVLGVKLRKPEAIPVEEEKVIAVQTYQTGETPELKVQAQVDKAGVINIVALTPGVVQKIPVKAGQTVKDGKVLVHIANNYQGGNTATLGKKIAQKNYQFVADTFETQKEIIAKNRDIALKSETLESDLRAITRASIDETKSMISLSEEIVDGLDDQLEILESTNVGGVNDFAILELQSAKAQVLGGLNAARAGLRSSEYMGSDTEEPAELARLSRDITLKQLDIQEKSLTLNKDLAALNVKIAKVTEGLFYPAAPCGGIVERVHVKSGEMVNPGTVLVSLVTQNESTSLVALVPGDVAQRVTPYGNVVVEKGSKTLMGTLGYISTEPTEAGLHSILVTMPDGMRDQVWQDEVVSLRLALGASKVSDGLSPFVPIDSVYQTRDEAFVYVISQREDGKSVAQVRKVVLGEVFGDSVIVNEGLQKGDIVIVSRNVSAGTVVTFE